MEYYITRNNQRQGPFDLDTLKKQHLEYNTLIWCEGMEDWTPAYQVADLSGYVMPEIRKSLFQRIFWILLIPFLIGCAWVIAARVHSNQQQKEQLYIEQDERKKEQEARERLEYEKSQARKTINEKVVISPSTFNTDFFGGINGLKISVQNKTDYLIDLALVEVEYILSNGGIFKTESLHFLNIPPHTEVTQYAPSSNRGKTVKCTMRMIKSADIDL